MRFVQLRVPTFDPENPEDETTKQLHDEIISALLAYTMNEKILKVVSDHGFVPSACSSAKTSLLFICAATVRSENFLCAMFLTPSFFFLC